MDDLKAYKKKRDFGKTKEPKGEKPRKKSAGLSFVVQKHDASHLHYDLRLEDQGVLKSWAIPKGPSLDPKIKRLAVQVEDHPLEYQHFEGIIPSGNYGAGTVIIWDNGTFELVESSSLFSDLYKKGHLKIIMHGTKLKGRFVLQRIKAQEKPLWILIKEKDEYADENHDITKKNKSVVSKKTLKQFNKDSHND